MIDVDMLMMMVKKKKSKKDFTRVNGYLYIFKAGRLDHGVSYGSMLMWTLLSGSTPTSRTVSSVEVGCNVVFEVQIGFKTI